LQFFVIYFRYASHQNVLELQGQIVKTVFYHLPISTNTGTNDTRFITWICSTYYFLLRQLL